MAINGMIPNALPEQGREGAPRVTEIASLPSQPARTTRTRTYTHTHTHAARTRTPAKCHLFHIFFRRDALLARTAQATTTKLKPQNNNQWFWSEIEDIGDSLIVRAKIGMSSPGHSFSGNVMSAVMPLPRSACGRAGVRTGGCACGRADGGLRVRACERADWGCGGEPDTRHRSAKNSFWPRETSGGKRRK